jgi:hypothetical protein
MPTKMIKLIPGVNVELTPTVNQTAYQTTNLIRFAPSGMPQKLGGWVKFFPFAVASIPRALHAWEALNGGNYLAIGCTANLYALTAGMLSDITPLIFTSNATPSLVTTLGSSIVTVNDPNLTPGTNDTPVFITQVAIGGLLLSGAYSIVSITGAHQYTIDAGVKATSAVSGGVLPTFTTVMGEAVVTVTLANTGFSVGSTFAVNLPVSVGGLVLSGFYPVLSIPAPGQFTIAATTPAASGATVTINGGLAQIQYYTPPFTGVPPEGYGEGGYGDGAYGSGVIPPATIGTPITAIDWSLDNFGGVLMAAPLNGPLFQWQPNNALATATIVSQAPLEMTGMFVAMQQDIVVAYGAEDLGVQDPLLVKWSNAADYTVWEPTTTNQAGSYRLPRGSRIVGGLQGPLYGVLWTDIDCWTMAYIGVPFVWSFTTLSTGCGLLAKFGAAVLGTTIYWISQKSFFSLPAGGSVTPLPCSVWDVIFQNIDLTNVGKVRTGANSQFGEVSWWFPVIGGNGENGMYVKYTPQFNAWDYGTMNRSAWIDQSIFGSPIGTNPNNRRIVQHEMSNDVDGLPMLSSFTTGYWAMDDGEDINFSDLTMPDMVFGFFDQTQGAEVNISFTATDYSQSSNVYSTPTYTMESGAPPFLNSRLRGRLMSMNLSSSDLGTFWRLGGLRVRYAPDGRL